NTLCVDGTGMTVKSLLVAALRPVAVASSPLPDALPICVRVEKLATPFTAATVVVPPSVLPPGLLPNATVTFPVNPGTGFPAGSRAVTWTAGLIAAPATVVRGCPGTGGRVAVPETLANPAGVTEPSAMRRAASLSAGLVA